MIKTTKELATEIKDELQKVLRLKASVSYTTNTLIVDLYSSDYDYSRVNLNYNEKMTVDDYVVIAMKAFEDALLNKGKDEYVTNYKASAVEKFIHEIIKQNQSDFIHIFDGQIFGDFENQSVPLDNIVEVNWKYGDTLLLTECDGGDMYYHTLDIENETIETKVELLELEM